MKLKICGIRTQVMIDFCHEHQVDFCGFNFVPTSKRKIDPAFMTNLPANFYPKKVALFMDQPWEEVQAILDQIDVDIIQFHGNESVEFIDQIRKKTPLVKVWKAFCIDDDFEIKSLEKYKNHVDLFLFDAANPGSGQTTQNTTSLAHAIQYAETQKIPYAIAGGINADNIDLFKNKFPKTSCLDTASGVEVDGQFDEGVAQELIKTLS